MAPKRSRLKKGNGPPPRPGTGPGSNAADDEFAPADSAGLHGEVIPPEDDAFEDADEMSEDEEDEGYE